MKKLKLIYVVYAIVIFVFLLYLVLNTNKFIEIHEIRGSDYSLKSIYTIVSDYGVFKLFPLFLIAFIAVFYRNRFTFLTLLIYFYFFITQIISFLFSIELDTYSLFFIALIIIPAFLIYILNKTHTYKDIFNLEKKSIMLYNLIALIIAFGISLLLAITNNSRYYEGLQF